jgi:hypothetical protein
LTQIKLVGDRLLDESMWGDQVIGKADQNLVRVNRQEGNQKYQAQKIIHTKPAVPAVSITSNPDIL